MKRLLILLCAASVSAPALAQHSGHVMPAPPPQAEQEQAPEAPAPAEDPHAGHNMPSSQPAAPADPMAGHDMSAMPRDQAADPMAGHDMSTMGEAPPSPPAAPPPPAAFSGPRHAADTIFPPQASADARDVFRDEHGSIETWLVMLDQFEARIRDGRDGYFIDGEAWYGGAIDRLWLKTEIEGSFGESPEQAEVQALWSHAIGPFFNLQAGARYDIRPDPERAHLVLGIEGLAPYWFEIDAAIFLSDEGDLTARFEGEYDQRLTQRLILQPRVEIDLAAQDIREIGVGAGLTTAEAGLRLRYEFVPEFAPYIGVAYERAFGDTADFRRTAGDDVGGWNLLVGVRTWF